MQYYPSSSDDESEEAEEEEESEEEQEPEEEEEPEEEDDSPPVDKDEIPDLCLKDLTPLDTAHALFGLDRFPLPPYITVPTIPEEKPTTHYRKCFELIKTQFSSSYGLDVTYIPSKKPLWVEELQTYREFQPDKFQTGQSLRIVCSKCFDNGVFCPIAGAYCRETKIPDGGDVYGIEVGGVYFHDKDCHKKPPKIINNPKQRMDDGGG